MRCEQAGGLLGLVAELRGEAERLGSVRESGGEREAGGTMLCPPWDRSRESHQAKPKRKGILCPPPPG